MHAKAYWINSIFNQTLCLLGTLKISDRTDSIVVQQGVWYVGEINLWTGLISWTGPKVQTSHAIKQESRHKVIYPKYYTNFYQKLLSPFTVWINCFSDLKNLQILGLQPWISKVFLDH